MSAKRKPVVPLSVHDQSVIADIDEIVVKPKLPKIMLPEFSGEITEFQGFWDRYETAIHNNPSLLSVDKFTYPHALLEGTVVYSIQGLVLAKANYQASMEILKSCFGNT